jgi:hypothetical protein
VTPYILLNSDGASFKAFIYRIYFRFTTVSLPNYYLANFFYSRKRSIAPSADRTRNEADNSATFLMSNMMPQVPEVNRGVWGDLEEYCRELVQQGKELYILAGSMERNGSIGRKEKIAVPAKNWKVIVVLNRQGLGMQGITSNTQARSL